MTAAGGIVAQGIIKSLKLANKTGKSLSKYRIIATDMTALAAGLHRCDMGIVVPPASSADFVDSLIKISTEQDIEMIYVGSDEELLVLGKEKKRIEDESGAKVVTNPLHVLITGRDKWKTFEFLRENNLQCATSALPEDSELIIQDFGFPLVVKPREGYGSLHVHVVKNNEELKYAVSKIQEVGWHPVLQEYLNSDLEFTCGVTIDHTGKSVMSSIAIHAIRKNGQTHIAFIDDFPDVRKSAEEVALKLGAIGPINVQSRLVDGKSRIFEINPRFSASCPMRAAAGINEPDIIFRNMFLGENIKIHNYQRLVCLRYWNEVYLPYNMYSNSSDAGIVTSGGSYTLDYL